MPQTLIQLPVKTLSDDKLSLEGIAKVRYKVLCANDATIPFYMQAWWLDAVCKKGNWDVCLSYDNAGEINGALVYYCVKLRGIISAIVMPELTPYSGIWLKLPDFEKSKKLSKYTLTKKIVESLVEQIPNVSLYHQKFHFSFTDWQPFFWAGYRSEIHYTYRLDLSDTEKIYSEMKGSVRTAIRKAEKTIRVETTENVTEFYKLCQKSLEKEGAKQPFHFETLTSLNDVLVKRRAGKIFIAKDEAGNAHGAIYIFYDDFKKSAHYLIGGSDPELRQSGAVMLLLWHAIMDAANTGYTVFDFEGSMIPNVEYAFRNFGATQTPFFRIIKAKNKFFDALTLFFPNYR